METVEIISIATIIVLLIAMISAAVSDWKTREVSDIHWAIMGGTGIILFTAFSMDQYGVRWEFVCLALASAIALFDVLCDRDWNPLLIYMPMAMLFLIPLYQGWDMEIMRAWITIPICYIVFVGLYLFGVFRGGADVKCLIAMSMLMPVYPSVSVFPLIDIPCNTVSEVLIFVFMALFFAALLVCIWAVISPIFRHGKVKGKFGSYRIGIDEASSSFVWPMEDIVEGQVISLRSIPYDEEKEVLERLKNAGCDTVSVTPMIPFMVPLAIASIFLVFVGNPFFLI